MLTMIREMLRTRAAGLLFALLIVAMAAWGITDVFSGGLGNNLIGAGNRTLSEQQFDNLVERELQNATDNRGRSLTKEQALDQGLIDQLLQREQLVLALDAYGDRLGITATQEAIRQEIVENSVFQDTTAVFDPIRYDQLLRDNGFTPAEFEATLESDLTQQRLRQLPPAALQIPSVLSLIEARYQLERRGAIWFILPTDAIPDIQEPE
ncbi:MAG: SurA N-terminal domain-containing protein, partial [Pseudomonadota bacterium]